jgi:hypothetical protein
MGAVDQLLEDLEAKRDIAYMEAKESHMKADILAYAVISLRNAIRRDLLDKQDGAKNTEQANQPDSGE